MKLDNLRLGAMIALALSLAGTPALADMPADPQGSGGDFQSCVAGAIFGC
jgi:hypothetical protein